MLLRGTTSGMAVVGEGSKEQRWFQTKELKEQRWLLQTAAVVYKYVYKYYKYYKCKSYC
jgi:hypothetical protein